VNTGSDKEVAHRLAYLTVQKLFSGNVPYYVRIWLKLINSLQKRRFPINIRS